MKKWFDKHIIKLIFIFVGFFLILPYVILFWGSKPTNDYNAWGVYLGIITPILSCITLVYLIITYREQQDANTEQQKANRKQETRFQKQYHNDHLIGLLDTLRQLLDDYLNYLKEPCENIYFYNQNYKDDPNARKQKIKVNFEFQKNEEVNQRIDSNIAKASLLSRICLDVEGALKVNLVIDFIREAKNFIYLYKTDVPVTNIVILNDIFNTAIDLVIDRASLNGSVKTEQFLKDFESVKKNYYESKAE